MANPLITSLSNPLVKRARALRHRKARLESDSFLVEGIAHVGEAVDAGWDVDSVIYAPDLLTSQFAQNLLSRLGAKAMPVSAQVMESLADKENPQGILAIVRQKHVRFTDLQDPRTATALISPQDPGNVGTILRTLDAVGVDVLFVLDGGVDIYHPTVVRASMGAIFWKPIVQASFDDFVRWARKNGYQLIGASARGEVEHHTLVPQIPWILVLGSEQKGLTPEQTRTFDVVVSLPMKGRVSSLNLSVAAGVLLYALSK